MGPLLFYQQACCRVWQRQLSRSRSLLHMNSLSLLVNAIGHYVTDDVIC